MSSRENILKNLNKSKPQPLDLESFDFRTPVADRVQAFREAVGLVGGTVAKGSDFDIKTAFPEAKTTGSTIPEYKGNIDLDSATLDILKSLDVAILKGVFGVAENGAVWVPEENMGQRVVPFIAEHLVIVLAHTEIVADMHEAYQRIKDLPGYGVFISGPSKTADIEQTLVFGAQGPLSLQIVLTD